MVASDDETVALSCNLVKNIQTIARIGPDGDVNLHLASCSRKNEVVQILLTNNAFAVIKNLSYFSSTYEEINNLLVDVWKLFHSDDEVQDYDYIQSSRNVSDLLQKRRQFREQIDVYRTYDNKHPLITKLLVEIIDYYLHEYLILHERFPTAETAKLQLLFQKAIDEGNYLKYFIKAYTLTNNFHRLLNKHLALYILDYLHLSSYPTKYRLINCLVHIVTLLINHPDIHRYQHRGVTYRGVLLTEKDLEHYIVGNYILNRSFVSTSKSRCVAQMFASSDSTLIPVLFTYTIKRSQTAIDIEHLSSVSDEKEVLILPFAVFEVKDRIDNDRSLPSPVLVEIDLEECEEERVPKRRLRNETRSDARYSMGLTCACAGILALLVIAGIILVIHSARESRKNKPFSQLSLRGGCPEILDRSRWNASESKVLAELHPPVFHVAIHHTTGAECRTMESCISRMRFLQNVHMKDNKWDDIGYNFIVGSGGEIFEGRGWTNQGAHCKYFNNLSIGIGVIGDYRSHSPTASSIAAIHSLIDCGISLRVIGRNYTFLGQGNYGVTEKFMAGLNQSHYPIQYCGMRT